jgi:PIN domain nuclease of toxin-antitoxin system
LLDTHALIWALSAPKKKLPAAALDAIQDPANDVFASAVCTWEVAIKSALGKIAVDPRALAHGISEAQFAELRVSIAHTLRVRSLESHHRDPFDRLLVAQALEEGLTIVTHDPLIGAYPAPVLWDTIG